jgi:hypothetical protein
MVGSFVETALRKPEFKIKALEAISKILTQSRQGAKQKDKHDFLASWRDIFMSSTGVFEIGSKHLCVSW